MKIDKSKLMKNAWKIARKAHAEFGGKVREYFSESLKSAWCDAKKSEINVARLTEIGREWKKGGHHRVYFNDLTDYFNTDDVRSWEKRMINRSGVLYYEVEKQAWFSNCHVDPYFTEIKNNILAQI